MRGVNVDGQRLRSVRVIRGLTQEQLAASAEVDVKTVRKAERSGRIDLATLSRLANALDVRVEQLVRDAEPDGRRAKQVVERWLAAWDAQDIELLMSTYHNDATLHLPGASHISFGGVFRGKSQIREANETAWATCRTVPYRSADISLLVSESTVFLQGMKGVYLPDGEVVSLWCVQSFRIEGDGIIEHRVEYDTLKFVELFGPSAATASPRSSR
jgi:transcriptional regulator with XRE-family HTH domain